MQIKTLWITRKGFESTPELLVAQDEYGADENPDWFDEQTTRELEAVGSDFAESRIIMLEVDGDAITRAFALAVIAAGVASSR